MPDSTADTVEHINKVQVRIAEFQAALDERASLHDRSKLQEPEKSGFDILTAKLAELRYGSDEYRAALAENKPTIDHHYAHNSHHPEHWPQNETDEMRALKRQIARYEDIAPRSEKMKRARKELAILESGLNGMSLLDVVEMFCDWKAASERTKQGSIAASIAHNKERFGISDQLASILENTVRELDW
jgi:hypothetical protein